jgi:hypothetical protein
MCFMQGSHFLPHVIPSSAASIGRGMRKLRAIGAVHGMANNGTVGDGRNGHRNDFLLYFQMVTFWHASCIGYGLWSCIAICVLIVIG